MLVSFKFNTNTRLVEMKSIKHFWQMKNSTLLLLIAITLVATWLSSTGIDCAPSSSAAGSSNNNNSNSRPRTGLLSSLFRRQTSSSSSDTSTTSTNDSADTDDPQTQTELDAQKFMDSLPNVGSSNSGPSSFRERMSETFGLLRDGWSNHFRSVRDNFADTVDDLRETWSSNQE